MLFRAKIPATIVFSWKILQASTGKREQFPLTKAAATLPGSYSSVQIAKLRANFVLSRGKAPCAGNLAGWRDNNITLACELL